MILLAFFFPLAVYLLLLGLLNRHRHPLLISGVWDGIGLIFGVSGFLLFAGPAVLTALSERWRLFWLFGGNNIPLSTAEGAWPMWAILAFFYFLLIVGGSALYLWRQRRLTAIYNANAEWVQHAVTDICKDLGLNPVRSGASFVFREQAALLEVDSFPLMHHVTLRWEPADAPLRRIVEAELNRLLAKTAAEDAFMGGWLLTAGFVLLSFDLFGTFFLLLKNLHLFVG